MTAAERTAEAIRLRALTRVARWAEHHLNNLQYRQTGRDPKNNGFAFAEVPDWSLNQMLSGVTLAIAGNDPEDEPDQ